MIMDYCLKTCTSFNFISIFTFYCSVAFWQLIINYYDDDDDDGDDDDDDGLITLISLFLVFFLLYFLFVSYDRLSWLSVSFLLHVKYTLSYRIVSYVISH